MTHGTFIFSPARVVWHFPIPHSETTSTAKQVMNREARWSPVPLLPKQDWAYLCHVTFLWLARHESYVHTCQWVESPGLEEEHRCVLRGGSGLIRGERGPCCPGSTPNHPDGRSAPSAELARSCLLSLAVGLFFSLLCLPLPCFAAGSKCPDSLLSCEPLRAHSPSASLNEEPQLIHSCTPNA